MKSVNASIYMKTTEELFEVLNNFLQIVEEKKNVMQVVINNGSNYVKYVLLSGKGGSSYFQNFGLF